MRKINLSGKRFGKLLVSNYSFSYKGAVYWQCKCDCGNDFDAKSKYLLNGDTKSCGCLISEILNKRNTKHSLSSTPEYKIWKLIKARCYNPNSTFYEHYGGRGIKMFEAWINNFESFIQHIGYRPTPFHSVERIKNDIGYFPGNLKWATKKEQASNKRTNRIIEYNGEKLILQQWADKFNTPVSTLHSRLKVNDIKTVFDKLCQKL